MVEDRTPAVPGVPAETAAELLPVVYEELRRLARAQMRGAVDVTLQPTALAHEAFLRLVEQSRTSWDDRPQFLAAAAGMMRRVLIDAVRATRRYKRGGACQRVTLSEELLAVAHRDTLDLLDLDEALRRLAAVHEREAKVVELRLFAGLSIDEAARVLGVSPRTVDDDWAVAKAWLRRELGR